ncbi:MAG: orotate phosphoribosyltransferase [Anaerolineaceae bacterium]|nr:orotate phosphoribosyltransferase [Anaerolineaceae bacterium]
MLDAQIARALLQIEAVGFSPYNPITFKSGILSPVYVDNRRLIYWPEQWRLVVEGFRQLVEREQLAFDVIAGIATGGVPHSSALAYAMQRPSIYIRSESKGHGKQNRIEGGAVEGKRILLVEDMITTGGSSLSGVAALRDAGAIVEHCLTITTYGFPMSRQAFEAANVRLHALAEFKIIVKEAQNAGQFGEAERALIEDWLDDPHQWAERQEDVHP